MDKRNVPESLINDQRKRDSRNEGLEKVSPNRKSQRLEEIAEAKEIQMRQDKYRAWDEDAEIMLYSDQDYDDYHFGFDKGKVVCWAREEVIPTDPMESPHFVGKPIENVMQFTDLKGKNSKEAYRGDLIDVKDGDYEARGVVEWDNESGQWVWRATDTHNSLTIAENQTKPLYVILNKQYRYQGKIIGDIHTTPKLIKK